MQNYTSSSHSNGRVVRGAGGSTTATMTATTTATTTDPAAYYDGKVDDDMFDDACDFGQFVLNPAYYMYMKLEAVVKKFFRDQSTISQLQSKDTKRSNILHLQLPLYLLFVVGGWTSVFVKVYPLLRTTETMSPNHPNVGYAVFTICLISWRYASTTSPGFITQDNISKYDHYGYDNILYVDATREKTATSTNISSSGRTHPHQQQRQQKALARSKFDRYSNKHVPRFDHYCGWLRQPIGEENYREFLLFVGIHACMCTYGTYVLVALIVRLRTSGQNFGGILVNDFLLTTIGVFLLSACVPLIGFFMFHLYLITNGMTTNEYYKWKLIKSRHETAQKKYDEYSRSNDRQQDLSDQRMIDEEGRSLVDIHFDSRDDIVEPGPMPSNMYDRGVVGNTLEVLFPRSLRKQASKND